MGSKAPDPPDPYKVADAQTGTNIKTAEAQKQLAMDTNVNPYGSIQYVIDPSSPSGYRAVTQFSPEMQALLNSAQANQANFNDIAGQQLGRVNDRLGQNFSLDAGRGTAISDIQRTMLDPQWSQMQSQLESQLANEGIRQGSDEYATRMRQFQQQRDDAYNKMYLDAYNTANSAAMTNYELPMMDLARLLSGGSGAAMPQMPQFGSTPAPGVAPTDLTSGVNSAYQGQVANANASLSGLYGLGAAGLGGWAKAGFPGAGAIGSALMALV